MLLGRLAGDAEGIANLLPRRLAMPVDAGRAEQLDDALNLGFQCRAPGRKFGQALKGLVFGHASRLHDTARVVEDHRTRC